MKKNKDYREIKVNSLFTKNAKGDFYLHSLEDIVDGDPIPWSDLPIGSRYYWAHEFDKNADELKDRCLDFNFGGTGRLIHKNQKISVNMMTLGCPGPMVTVFKDSQRLKLCYLAKKKSPVIIACKAS